MSLDRLLLENGTDLFGTETVPTDHILLQSSGGGGGPTDTPGKITAVTPDTSIRSVT